jgi:preprotein translocase subunit Sec63
VSLVQVKDYYNILEVSPEASPETITQAYRRLVKKHHPDRFFSSRTKESRNHWMQEINEAYRVLSQPSTRSAYDKTYQKSQSQPSETIENPIFKLFQPQSIKRIGQWALVAILVLICLKIFWVGLRLLFITPLGKLGLLLGAFWVWQKFRSSRLRTTR